MQDGEREGEADLQPAVGNLLAARRDPGRKESDAEDEDHQTADGLEVGYQEYQRTDADGSADETPGDAQAELVDRIPGGAHRGDVTGHHRGMDALPVYRGIEHVAQYRSHRRLDRETLVYRVGEGVGGKQPVATTGGVSMIAGAGEVFQSLQHRGFLPAPRNGKFRRRRWKRPACIERRRHVIEVLDILPFMFGRCFGRQRGYGKKKLVGCRNVDLDLGCSPAGRLMQDVHQHQALVLLFVRRSELFLQGGQRPRIPREQHVARHLETLTHFIAQERQAPAAEEEAETGDDEHGHDPHLRGVTQRIGNHAIDGHLVHKAQDEGNDERNNAAPLAELACGTEEDEDEGYRDHHQNAQQCGTDRPLENGDHQHHQQCEAQDRCRRDDGILGPVGLHQVHDEVAAERRFRDVKHHRDARHQGGHDGDTQGRRHAPRKRHQIRQRLADRIRQRRSNNLFHGSPSQRPRRLIARGLRVDRSTLP